MTAFSLIPTQPQRGVRGVHFSVSDCRPVRTRIGSSQSQSVFRVYEDAVRAAHVLGPIFDTIDVVASLLQFRERRIGEAAFQREGPVRLVEQVPPRDPPRRLDRRLDVQPEIKDGGHDLSMGLGLPIGSARAEHQEGGPVPEGHGGHEGMERPLVRFKAVHVIRVQGEIGSAVLENDARLARNHRRAEGVVEGLDQRYGIPRLIDHTKVNRIPAGASRATVIASAARSMRMRERRFSVYSRESRRSIGILTRSGSEM